MIVVILVIIKTIMIILSTWKCTVSHLGTDEDEKNGKS